MSEPVEAWCPVYYFFNGGAFNDKGAPIDVSNTLGNCPHPYDCHKCDLLDKWLNNMRSYHWAVTWECIGCISSSKKPNDLDNLKRIIPGFYQAGRTDRSARRLLKQFPGFDNSDPDSPTAIPGCATCGEASSILQVVLRRHHEPNSVG
jgi:hypothetical protein